MELIVNNKLITADIIDVLEQLRRDTGGKYFKKIVVKGDNIQCTCPSHKDGQENKPSCSIYNSDEGETERGWVHCFACGYNVPLYKMIADIFNEDEEFGKQWLINRFSTTIYSKPFYLEPLTKEDNKSYHSEAELEQYKYHTNYWATRGISDEVVNRFDLGFDVQQNMVVFPIRDLSGKVAMITKRSVTSKYFYIEEARSKPVYLLYDIIKNNIDKVYVVESQINALTLWTWGYPAIALIGTGAEEQYKILRRSGIREYILCFDGDVAGDSGRRRFIKNMSDEILISVKELPRGKDVNDLTKEQFDSLPEKLL